MPTPLRSQSFRHRSRPLVELRHFPLEDISQERRRSTPTVGRRSSLQRNRIETQRRDVWPEPKQMSEIEERFLKLPNSEDYTRVRQFKIDAKGAVVSRGDSFRRKRHAATANHNNNESNKHEEMGTSPFPVSDIDNTSRNSSSHGNISTTELSPTTINNSINNNNNPDSRSTSVSSNGSIAFEVANKMAKVSGSRKNTPNFTNQIIPFLDETSASTSHPSYKICVLGQTGSGKSSLISQFITSEYRNAFADDIAEADNTTVSINIGGHECELVFYEADPQVDLNWKQVKVQAYLLIYSIDRKSSFRTMLSALESIRETQKSVPIILAGNKIDLERRRNVSSQEVKSVALTYEVAHFEISVALNHDVDDLLVGIVAEIKDSFVEFEKEVDENKIIMPQLNETEKVDSIEDFRAAIRRFSQRKKKQMGTGSSALEMNTGKCVNLNPVGLFEKFRQWRRGSTSKC